MVKLNNYLLKYGWYSPGSNLVNVWGTKYFTINFEFLVLKAFRIISKLNNAVQYRWAGVPSDPGVGDSDP